MRRFMSSSSPCFCSYRLRDSRNARRQTPLKLDSARGKQLLSECIRGAKDACTGLEQVGDPPELTVCWDEPQGRTTCIIITIKNPPQK